MVLVARGKRTFTTSLQPSFSQFEIPKCHGQLWEIKKEVSSRDKICVTGQKSKVFNLGRTDLSQHDGGWIGKLSDQFFLPYWVLNFWNSHKMEWPVTPSRSQNVDFFSIKKLIQVVFFLKKIPRFHFTFSLEVEWIIIQDEPDTDVRKFIWGLHGFTKSKFIFKTTLGKI